MAEEPTQTAAAPEGDAAPPAEGAAPAEGGNKKKLLMLVSIALAVVGVVVAAGVFFLLGGKDEAEAHAEDKPAELPAMAMFDVPQFTLNLLTDEATGGARFLKITLSLELANAADSANAGKLLPRLQDDWGTYLRQLRANDLQGSAAMQRLKEGLLRRATQSMAPVEVKAVYIRDMLVQ